MAQKPASKSASDQICTSHLIGPELQKIYVDSITLTLKDYPSSISGCFRILKVIFSMAFDVSSQLSHFCYLLLMTGQAALKTETRLIVYCYI